MMQTFSRNVKNSYGKFSKLMHWSVFILVTSMLVCGFYLEDIPKAYAATAFSLHKLTGLIILFLMILRLCWTRVTPKPSLSEPALPWQRMIEKVVHALLYVVIISMSGSAWMGSTAFHRAPKLAGLSLDFPIIFSKATGKLLFVAHQYLAYAIIALVSLHAIAALYHHFIKRDTVLKSMLPFYSSKNFNPNV